MPLRPITEPPLPDDVEEDRRKVVFALLVALTFGLSVVALVLHYRFH